MELSNRKIKKFLILYNPNLNIFPKKNFLYFLIFREMELSCLKIKNILIFIQKTFFLYPGKRNYLVLLLKNFRREFPSSKNKKNLLWKGFLYFGKCNVIKTNFLIFLALKDKKYFHCFRHFVLVLLYRGATDLKVTI